MAIADEIKIGNTGFPLSRNSGARYLLVLDPRGTIPHVYVDYGTGVGTPVDVLSGECLSFGELPHDLDSDSLRAYLEGQAEVFLAIAARFRGVTSDAHGNPVGHWDEPDDPHGYTYRVLQLLWQAISNGVIHCLDDGESDDDDESEDDDDESDLEWNAVFLCQDCTMAIANDDYSGIESDARVAEVKASVRAMDYCCLGDVEHDFSRQPCDCCHTRLAGNRQEFYVQRRRINGEKENHDRN